MDKLVFSLCPSCTACPEVALAGEQVQIGEAGNLVTLTKEEWNVLVGLIRSGRLGELSPGGRRRPGGPR